MTVGERGRVLFAVPSAFPVGGVATWLDILLPDLISLGWECWLGLTQGRYSDPDAYLRHHPFEPHVRFENPTGTKLGRRRAIERVLERAAPDVIVSSNLIDVLTTIGRLRSEGSPTPRVAFPLHAFEPGFFADIARSDVAIDLIVAPNRLALMAARDLSSFPVERLAYAPYGVDCPPGGMDPSEEQGLVLVYHGRFDNQQKRVHLFPAILRELDLHGVSWRFELAGCGPDEAALRMLLADFGDRVRWHGAMTPAAARDALLRPGRVLLLGSVWETGPIAAWEAMAREVLVVAPRFVGSGLEGALRNGETAILYEPHALDRVAIELAELVDPARRREIAVAGRREVLGRYGREVAAAAWDTALRRVLRMPSRETTGVGPSSPSGRLERWLGAHQAERLRRALGLQAKLSGPGDEWPHTGGGGLDHEAFFARLEEMDRGEADPSIAGRSGGD